MNVLRREHYWKNRDQALAYARAKAESRKEYSRTYYEANRERIREYHRQWVKNNPDLVAAKVHRRRARLAGVESVPYTRREIYDRDGGKCRICRVELSVEGKRSFHIDHIVPLSLGGPDIPANVQLACPSCNLSKQATLTGQIHLPIG